MQIKFFLAAAAMASAAAAHAAPPNLSLFSPAEVVASVRGEVAIGHSGAQEALDSAATGVRLKVSYAETLQGMSALYAVRVCAYDERTGSFPRLVESKATTALDIELQLFDTDGAEVSRFSGSKAICDYARFAAAFAARTHQTKERPHD